MIQLLQRPRLSPIGVDIGAQSVKLLQLASDRSHVEVSRWELSSESGSTPDDNDFVRALQLAYSAGNFRGRDAVLCLSNEDLFLQNMRVPIGEENLERRVIRDTADRLPFPPAEAELRFLPTADVRQGESMVKEVIVMACQKTAIDRRLSIVENAGFAPVALDVEPLALARNFSRQQRRCEEQKERAMIVHIGYSRTVAVIVQEAEVQFIKYIDVGGRDLDQAVAEHLHLELPDAIALRGHRRGRSDDFQRDGSVERRSSTENSGGRRRGAQEEALALAEPLEDDLAASVARATRPVLERLTKELLKCVKYYSVTFRGSLQRISLSGGEATEPLRIWLSSKLKLRTELSDSLRGIHHRQTGIRSGNWDIAMGLALRELK